MAQDFTRYGHYEAGKFHVIGLDQKRTAKRSRLELFAEEFHGVLIPVALRPPLCLHYQERQIRSDFDPEIRATVLIYHKRLGGPFEQAGSAFDIAPSRGSEIQTVGKCIHALAQ